MTFKELNFFYKLCENPQVTQVAFELNISQSAVSLAIKSLENSLNEKLFDRIGKKLILNEKGKFFKEKTFSHYMALLDAQNIFQENLSSMYKTINDLRKQLLRNIKNN